MRHPYAIPAVLAVAAVAAPAQVSVSIGFPGVSIGINVPVFPELVPVPGEPIYYAPQVDSNYFFYDGLYWVFVGDYWYSSSWYNGPWRRVDRYVVPGPLLRVPVRYYRRPPAFFGGWRGEERPHWDEHWGRGWKQKRKGWDRDDEDRREAAPIPDYQREYAGGRYPMGRQQRDLHNQYYRYQPSDPAVRERYRQEDAQGDQPWRKDKGGKDKGGKGKGKGRGLYPYPPPPGSSED